MCRVAHAWLARMRPRNGTSVNSTAFATGNPTTTNTYKVNSSMHLALLTLSYYFLIISFLLTSIVICTINKVWGCMIVSRLLLYVHVDWYIYREMWGLEMIYLLIEENAQFKLFWWEIMLNQHNIHDMLARNLCSLTDENLMQN